MNRRAQRVFPAGVALSAFVALLAPAAAAGSEWTLTLPVSLEKLHPDITAGRVECRIFTAPANESDPAAEIGHGYSANFAIVGGAYHGAVEVPVTTPPGVDTAEARSYTCSMEMQANGAWFDLAMAHPRYPMNASLPHHIVAKGEIH